MGYATGLHRAGVRALVRVSGGRLRPRRGRVTNFTAGQGLILMKEVLHVIAGKRLPVVFHVGARALTSQGLNIHAGHDDVMALPIRAGASCSPQRRRRRRT